MKNVFRIVTVILAIVLCLGVFASCKDKNNAQDGGETSAETEAVTKKEPADVVQAATQKYTDAVAAKFDGNGAAIDKITEGAVSYELLISIDDLAEIALNAAGDPETGAGSGKLSIEAMDIAAEAELWLDKGNLALSIPALIGDGVYGLKLDTIKDDIKNAPILDAIGVTYEQLISAIESQGISLDDISGAVSSATASADLEKYTDEIVKVFSEIKPTIEAEKDAVTALYTVTKEKVDDFGEALKDLYTAINNGSDQGFSFTTSDFESIDFKVYVSESDEKITKVDIIVDEDNHATVTFTDSEAKPFDVTVNSASKNDEFTEEITLTLKESDDEGTRGFYLDFTNKTTLDDETIERTGGFSAILYDTGKYEIEAITDGKTDMLITGELSFNDTELLFTVDSIDSSSDEETPAFTFSFKLSSDAKVEKIPEYTNILDMTQADLQSLVLEFASSPIGQMIVMGGLGNTDDSYDDDEWADDEWDTEDWDEDYWDTYEWDTEDWDEDYWDTYEWDTEDWDEDYWDTYEWDTDPETAA